MRQTINQLAGQTQNFSYDALDRLTAAAATGGSAGVYSESYGYAPTGNLTSKAGAAYTYADAAHVHAVTHVGGAPKACYDQNGNQTVRLAGDTLHVLAYDAENHLTGVSRRGNLSASSGRSGTSVALSWPAVSGATAYEVWRGTAPYFTPVENGSVKVTTTTATSYSDPGRSGDPATNYYYLIIATANNCPLGVSQRLGEFDFALTPGTLAGVAAVRAFKAEVEAKTLSLNLNLNLVDTPIASFTYDAAGQRISATVDGVTTVYPFAHYEVEGTTVRKYYLIGGQRVAMRTAGALSYLLTDHLGSTAVTTDAAGVKAGELRYLPFGATRTTWGLIPTDRRFTGQPRYATLGLDYFGARWYDPALGRFISADTIVPEPGNPQALNRYSYALNNALRYTDPSGHAPACGVSTPGGGCDDDAWYRLTQQWYGIGDQGFLDATILAWLQDHQDIRTIQAMASYLETTYGQSGAILPSSFNTIYAHAFAAGELAQLATNPRAQLLAGAIFAGVGVGGANLGGLKQEMAGRTTVYRVWGTEPNDPDFARQSGPWGSSWTTTDPSTVPNYRAYAGLPSGGASGALNTGRFVSVGTLRDSSGVQLRSALALDGQPGGLIEVLVPNPKTQIELIGVYGVNPPY